MVPYSCHSSAIHLRLVCLGNQFLCLLWKLNNIRLDAIYTNRIYESYNTILSVDIHPYEHLESGAEVTQQPHQLNELATEPFLVIPSVESIPPKCTFQTIECKPANAIECKPLNVNNKQRASKSVSDFWVPALISTKLSISFWKNAGVFRFKIKKKEPILCVGQSRRSPSEFRLRFCLSVNCVNSPDCSLNRRV